MIHCFACRLYPAAAAGYATLCAARAKAEQVEGVAGLPSGAIHPATMAQFNASLGRVVDVLFLCAQFYGKGNIIDI